MSGVTVRTCAKVNFCLRVLSRRPDGYHNIESVLHAVGLWDTVRLTERDSEEGISITVQGEPVPTDETNLCWKATRVLQERAKTARGVLISLHKHIPTGAGLAGGSSDAAATLVGLTRLWSLTMTREELLGVAAAVGSDVPFFLLGGCCLARERGEKLEPLPSVALSLVVVVPERRVSTAQAYAALGRGASLRRRRALTGATRRVVEAVTSGAAAGIAAAMHNDFEAVGMLALTEALKAKAALAEVGCLGALLSGSGSAVFGIAPDRTLAESIVRRLRETWAWVSIAPTLSAEESMIVSDETMEAQEP